MSFLLFVAMTAAAAASAGFFAARKKSNAEGAGQSKGAKRAARSGAKGKSENMKVEKASAFASLPLALGDVVSGDGSERWLSGAIVAREEGRIVGALFLAPEGASERAVAVFAPPRRDIYWLAPAQLETGAEPPDTLEVSGVALHRRGRVPVTLERMGHGAPNVSSDGIWAVYETGGRDVALILTSAGRAFSYTGVRLDEGEYDRLGTG